MAIEASKGVARTGGVTPALHIGPVGVLELKGRDCLGLLQRLSTGDLRPLAQAGYARDTLFLTAQGRAFAWATVVRDEDCFYLLVHPTKVTHLAVWLDTYTIMDDVTTTDVSAHFVQATCFDGAFGQNIRAERPALGVRRMSREVLFQDVSGLRLSGLFALGASALFVLPAEARTQTALEARQCGYLLLTDAALDIRKISAGIPRENVELKDEVNPFEMRLAREAVSWNKGCYIGQEVLSRLDAYDKVARLMMGFVLPNQAQRLVSEPVEALRLSRQDRNIGRILSILPRGDDAIGLAMVKRSDAVAGAFALKTSMGETQGELLDLPFWMER